ncbi:MAG: N-acetylmuramoyl-L-alanine amidase [Bacteroidetes bacterium]|nr:N-acetylmuramoyl-L-alanine amidase [Bacteroidota bacterium]
MKFKIKFLSLLSLLMIQGTVVSRIKKYKLKKILIDPGHGGKDYGCRSNGINEKDVALSVSLKLGQKIKAAYNNDVEIIYTRKKDIFRSLKERLDKIRKYKPDLVISIHCNGSKNKKVKGFEVYVRGKEAYWPTFKMKANLDYYSLRAVERENRVILMEENYKEKYKEFNNNSIYSKIAAQNYNNAYLKNSIKLASMMVEEVKSKNIKSPRGVLRDGFIILAKSPFAAVLVELNYLSNAKTAKYLNTEEGKNKYVSSLFHAIKKYKEEIEK